MKGISSKISKPLCTMSRLVCDDNSGAKIVEIIGRVGYKGTRNKYVTAGIGDIIIVSVKKGSPKIRKKIEKAVIIRQKKPIRRSNGLRVMFEDNAAIIVDDNKLPKGSEIKGAVAREVAERFPKLAAIASSVV
jgi:large subunit ribosomal protein L14